MRRWLVFLREKRQWFMILAPFVSVLSMVLVVTTVVLAVSGDQQKTKEIQQIVAISFPTFLLYGFCTSSGIYMITSLFDKEKKLRQYMYLSGVGPVSYYLGMFTADFLLFFVTEMAFLLFIFAFRLEMYSSQFWKFSINMTTFGLVLIPFTYMFQHFFSNADSAFRFIGLAYLVVGLLLPLALVMISALIAKTSGVYAANAFCYFVDPFYTFYASMQNLIQVFYQNGPLPITPNLHATAGLSSLIMSVQACVALSLAIWYDHRMCTQFKNTGGQDGVLQPQLEVQPDMKEHEAIVRQKGNDGEYLIKAVNLKKTFGRNNFHFQAVSGNTFGVRKGEILGMLGPNGAGKSTTFSMMCLDIPKTSGEAKILQSRVEDLDVLEQGSRIGLCPQYNTLWEQLTVNESLNLVARMKGLSLEDRDRNKRLILETLELNDFIDTKAGNLSGGNKRKLCCAQTLLVCPKVEFLDEPTTGVDPVARRSLLRMVKQLSNSSVLLSTHRMDEAEQLCDNISIMINGKMICYGSPSYLKKEYGEGYTLRIRQSIAQRGQLNVPSIVRQQILNAKPEVEGPSNENPDHYEYTFTATIDSSDPEKRLSKMFATLSDILLTGNVLEFTLTRTTLEQVFVNFAKFQVRSDIDGENLTRSTWRPQTEVEPLLQQP